LLSALDLALLRLLRTRFHNPPIEQLVLRFTRLGEHGGLWLAIAALGFLFDRRARPVYARAARVVVLTYVTNTAIKLGIRRARPLLEDLPPLSPTVTGLSYPSAHASTSFAAASALGDALPATPLRVAAAAMALSRCYIGVHYPSDILAGALLGGATAKLLP
jgi:membrane-associated phospholipid phosphatase